MATGKLTVLGLFEACKQLIACGYGEAPVYSFSDDEGNSARPLWSEQNIGLLSTEDLSYYKIPDNAAVIG